MTEQRVWEPQDPEDMRSAVMQAMGSASMAWIETPTGEFDSDWAKAVGEGLIKWINENYAVMGWSRVSPDAVEGCGCWTCVQKRANQITDFSGRLAYASRMIVCPDSGNKRCPKGTWHGNACTGSNDPEQPGSRYGGL
jgi:hypothetical protein